MDFGGGKIWKMGSRFWNPQDTNVPSRFPGLKPWNVSMSLGFFGEPTSCRSCWSCCMISFCHMALSENKAPKLLQFQWIIMALNKKLQFWGYAVSAGVLEIDGEDFLTICTFTNHSWKNSSSIPRMKSPRSLGAESFTTRSNSLAAAKSSYGHMGWSTNLVSKQNNLLKRLGEFRRSYPNSTTHTLQGSSLAISRAFCVHL